ncbi:MAG: hypothetical protein K940chlam9_00242 [Chlamydiae bacterium]|nr:hypothetical protein [Chlamydiota bacterium]
MNWKVDLTAKAVKQRARLPEKVQAILDRLTKQMEVSGPIRKDWKNFGKLIGSNYHCHLKNGRPTYVACWTVVDKKIQIIEVYYAGTHENAPY